MKKIAVFGGAFLAVYASASLAWAQQVDPFCRPSMMWDDGWYGWFLVVVLIVRWLGGTGHSGSAAPPPPASKHAIDILKDRFARGEIDKEELEEKRRILEE